METSGKSQFCTEGTAWAESTQAALRSSSVSIIDQDLDLRITGVCNPPGGMPPGELLGRTELEVADHPDEASVLTEIKRNAIETGTVQRRRVAMHLNGEFRHFDLTVSPSRDGQDQVMGVTTVAVDITGHMRAMAAHLQREAHLESTITRTTEVADLRTRQLQALAVELIEAEERERERIADLLHDDLQQILVSAMLQLQTTQMGVPPSPVVQQVIQLLDESIQKSRKLSHELSPAVLHHSGLATAIEWLAGQMDEQHGLSVDLMAEEWDDEEAEPFKVLVFRAVQELLFNVVKHARTGHASVGLRRTEQNLEVSVSDEGAGFDAENVQHYGRGSTGFGLLSIRERADSVGGSFSIRSEPGGGSRFLLTLPCSRKREADPVYLDRPGSSRTADPESPDTQGTPGEFRVLFVDDHQVMRQGLISMVRKKPGIRVVGEASNGREAIEMAFRLQPDVIVMDVSLPEIDGIEATRRIKKELPRTRIIGLSMFDDEGTAGMMRNAGAEAFISKAESSGILLKVIYGIGGKQAEEQRAGEPGRTVSGSGDTH